MNTHGLAVDFGKHKGELWTRIPISYLKWVANECDGDRRAIAVAEMSRRGVTIDSAVEISGHAIDRASQRCRHIWHQNKIGDEGLHAWLTRIANEAAKTGDESVCHGGLELRFSFGAYYPVLKTVMPHKPIATQDVAA